MDVLQLSSAGSANPEAISFNTIILVSFQVVTTYFQ